MNIRFVNSTFLEIEGYCLVDGKETLRYALAPMECCSQPTEVNETWVFRDKHSGVQVGAALMSSDLTQVDITEANIRSQVGTNSLSLAFINRNTFPVRLYWIAYDGSQVFLSCILQPGQSDSFIAHSTHAFRVCDAASGKEVFFYIANQSTPQLCSILTRSYRSSTGCEVTFKNACGTSVDVFWLDWEGKEVKYHTLPAGDSYLQRTYAGHPWLIRDATTGRVVDVYIAGCTEQTVILSPADEILGEVDLSKIQAQALGEIAQISAAGGATEGLLQRWQEFIQDAVDQPVSANNLVMEVLRKAYQEEIQDLKFYAQKVQFLNEQQEALRVELETLRELRANAGFLEQNDGLAQLDKLIAATEARLDAVREDAQLANLDLQNSSQAFQQMQQTMAQVSKALHDTAMAVI
jgi:hypothetical protein